MIKQNWHPSICKFRYYSKKESNFIIVGYICFAFLLKSRASTIVFYKPTFKKFGLNNETLSKYFGYTSFNND